MLNQSMHPVDTIFLFIWVLMSLSTHCIGHIIMGSWKGRGNQYIQLVKFLYCKLLTNGKQLPASQHEVRPGTEPRFQRWEARVLPLCHRGPPPVDTNTQSVNLVRRDDTLKPQPNSSDKPRHAKRACLRCDQTTHYNK